MMNGINKKPEAATEERRKYVMAYNATMLKIWKEKIAMLGVVDTGELYRSVLEVSATADGKVVEVSLHQKFNTYGLFQDYGTGREVPRGNPGDIGRAKVRTRRKWFSVKYFASVMNLQEFFADSLGKQSALVVAAGLNAKTMRAAVTV